MFSPLSIYLSVWQKESVFGVDLDRDFFSDLSHGPEIVLLNYVQIMRL